MTAIIFANNPDSSMGTKQLHGMTFLERHLRVLVACDIRHAVVVFSPDQRDAVASLVDTINLNLETKVVGPSEIVDEIDGFDSNSLLLIDADYVFEGALLRNIIGSRSSTILVDSESTSRADTSSMLDERLMIVGCARVDRESLKSAINAGFITMQSILSALYREKKAATLDIASLPTFNKNIRRHRRGFWMRPSSDTDIAFATRQLLDGTQKGGQDLPAKWLHAPLENRIVLRLAEYPVTPNQLTLITNIMAWLVTWAILSGYVLIGLVVAAGVGVLDGVDGKLARLKLMTSKVGEFEHVFDMLFEYSWWLALGWVLGAGDTGSAAFVLGVGLLLCNFSDHAIAIVFWYLLGRRHERTIDNYTPFDLWFRNIAGRRNIYVWLLLLTGPMLGWQTALGICVAWGIVTILVRGGRTFWHVYRGYPPLDFEIVFK